MSELVRETDVTGLKDAEEAYKTLREAHSLIRELPSELFSKNDLFGPPELQYAHADWLKGLREVVKDEWREKLVTLHDTVLDAQFLTDQIWVRFHILLDNGEWFESDWRGSGGRFLIEKAVKALNHIEHARKLQKDWDWDAPAIKLGDPGFEPHSRDWLAYHVALHLDELDRDLTRHLRDLLRLSRRARRTKEQNAATRARIDERNDLQVPEPKGESSATPDKTPSTARSNRARAPIDGKRLEARAWRECKLILGSDVVATTTQGGGHRIVHVRDRYRTALALLANLGETDFDARTPSRKRSMASELRKLFNQIYEGPSGDPVPCLDSGKYTTELIIKVRDQLTDKDLDGLPDS